MDENFVPVDPEDPFVIRLRESFRQNGPPKYPWKSSDVQYGPGSLEPGLTTKACEPGLEAYRLGPATNEPINVPSGPKRIGLAQVIQEHFEHSIDTVNDSSITGIMNPGAICYVNSVLQALFHTHGIASLLKDINDRATFDIMGVSDRPILDALLATFEDYQSHGIRDEGGYITADVLFDAVEKKFQLDRYRQEDAHEFLILLLSALEDELAKYPFVHGTTSSTASNASSSWIQVGKASRPLKSTTSGTVSHSAIGMLFQGEMKTKVGSSASRFDSVTVEPFQDLQVMYESTLPRAVQRLFEVESVGSGNNRVIVREVEKLPHILVVQVKRFEWIGNQSKKITGSMECPLELCLTEGQDQFNEVHYSLKAVIYHHGDSLEAGHYTVDLVSSQMYVHVDDTMVSVEKSNPAFKNAYLVFYERRT